MLAIFDTLYDSELLQTLASYRWTGRKGYSLKALWHAYIASYYLNLSCTNDLIRHLQDNDSLAAVCGFDKLPSRWTFNRFWNRLSHHAGQVEEILTSLTDELATLLPDFGKQLAIDSTIVEAYSNPDKKTKEGTVSDVDASWTAKSYNKGTHQSGKGGKSSKASTDVKKEWFFGYKLHILADAFWELPVVVKVTTAKENDSPHLMSMMRKARERHSWFNPELVTADSGYDGINNYKGIYHEFNAVPIIDIRDMGRKSEWAFYNKDGIPFCLGRKLMEYLGSDDTGHTYRCLPEKCHLYHGEETPYCNYVIKVKPEDDLRKIGPIARISSQWKELFSKRTSVERVNSRLKETRRLRKFCFRRIRKVTVHCLMSVLAMQASAVSQARAGNVYELRQCLRKVA